MATVLSMFTYINMCCAKLHFFPNGFELKYETGRSTSIINLDVVVNFLPVRKRFYSYFPEEGFYNVKST